MHARRNFVLHVCTTGKFDFTPVLDENPGRSQDDVQLFLLHDMVTALALTFAEDSQQRDATFRKRTGHYTAPGRELRADQFPPLRTEGSQCESSHKSLLGILPPGFNKAAPSRDYPAKQRRRPPPCRPLAAPEPSRRSRGDQDTKVEKLSERVQASEEMLQQAVG